MAMTSAMAEAFDTHMTDPADIDISMYTGSTTTDSWLPVEASMGDDAYAADAATFHYDQGGIEIEMGVDDEPITEYEMADEGQVYDGHDIQDIEVYDISQDPSPLPMGDHDVVTTAQPHAEDADIMHIPSSDGPAPEPPLDLHATAIEVPATSQAVSTVDSTPSADTVESTFNVANHDLTVHQQDASSAVQVLETLPAETISAPVDGGVPEVEPLSVTSGRLGAVERTAHEDTSGEQTAEHEPNPQYDDCAQLEFVQYDNHAAEPEDFTPHLQVDTFNGSAATQAPDGNDPHEISDGVYIDPPPAVLLSLPPSAEFGECCLFNLPLSNTQQSPSSSAQPDMGIVRRLLLQERPTLYYEPLSAVFAALRSEESIQAMQGFSEAELVLDAYDLQLSIPEDNIYTHEVTLHELNVIHDGSDLGGPLRLRLKVFTPRFVTRYNMLRDQISRLDLAENGGVHAEQQYEQDYAGHRAQQVDEEAEKNHYEDNVALEPRLETHEELVGNTAVTDEDPRDQAEAGTHEENRSEVGGNLPEEQGVCCGGGVVTGVSPALQAAQLEAEEERLAAEDADADGEYEESATFDADEIHGHVTAEEGGDYTEHADFPDDEDEFGEDLPEEVGGETKDAAYPHIGAADDLPERPQDENDFEREVPTGVVGEHEEQQFDNTGLHTNPYTDARGETNSVQASQIGIEDPLRPTSEAFTEEDVVENLEADNVGLEETTAFVEEVEDDGLDDNWDEADTLSSHEDANLEEQADPLSRKSSTTTLASAISKRAHEEVDLDDFDDEDDAFFDTSASSPNAKRLRTE